MRSWYNVLVNPRTRISLTWSLIVVALVVVGGLIHGARRFPAPATGPDAMLVSDAELRIPPTAPCIGVRDDAKGVVRGATRRTREVRILPAHGRILHLESLTSRLPGFVLADSLEPILSSRNDRFSLTPDLYLEEGKDRVSVRRFADMETVWSLAFGSVWYAAMSEEESRLFLAGEDGRGCIFDLSTGARLLLMNLDPDDTVATLSPDGRYFAVGPIRTPLGSWKGEVIDLDAGGVVLRPEHPGVVEVHRFPDHPERVATSGIRFDRSGRIFAYADSWRSVVYLHDLSTGRELAVRGILLDAVGTALAVYDPTGESVRVVRPGPRLSRPIPIRGRLIASYAARGAPWLALHVVESGRPTVIWKLLGEEEKRCALVVLDLARAETVLATLVEGNLRLGFSPSGRILAAQDGDDRLRVWRLPEER